MDNTNRKNTRLKYYNYDKRGICFITICTKERRNILSQVVGTGVPDCPLVALSEYGEIADKYIKQLSEFYDDINVSDYVIMPDHIHMMIVITEDGPSGTPVPTDIQNSKLSRFISTFKRFCNKEYSENIWQRRSYDHIIRDRDDYCEHLKYIHENPKRWYYKQLSQS